MFLSTVHPRLPDGGPIGELWDLDTPIAARLSTGIEHRDGREGWIRAAVWSVYQRIAEILESVGSSLDQIVRQRLVVSDPADILPAEDALLGLLAPEMLPATVFNCESSRGRGAQRGLGVEIVAFREGYGVDLARIRVPGLDGLTDPYPQATRVGQLTFSSSISAGTRAPGKYGGEFISSGRSYSDQVHHSLRAQLLECFDNIESILDFQGAGLNSLLRQTFFTTSDRQAWGFTSIDRQRLFDSPGDFPTASAFGVQAIYPDTRVEVSTDIIGLTPGDWVREAVVYESVTMGHLPMCVSCGPFLFTTGYIGMDKESHSAVAHYSDLKEPESLLGTSYDDTNERVRSQTWHIYREILRILSEQGSGPEGVVQQTVYLTDLAAFPAVESVARSVFGGSLPATTVIGVGSMGPYRGLEVEVEVIGVR